MNQDLNKEILERGVNDIIVKDELIEKLNSGKPLRIKFGIDPTGKDLHIGHMVPLRKLAQFQKAGHHITLIFGNFTGQIGDPTDKAAVRVPKTQAELEENAKTYLDQAKYALDINNLEVVWNADWLQKLDFNNIIELCAQFTVSQMLERDMFQKRIEKNAPISLHEFFYPIMQGYDSVHLKTDVEIGGNDQYFNMLAARPLQKHFDQTPQCVLTVPLLIGTDGSQKMGKSLNNYIAVKDTAKDMFGKVMSIPDELIIEYFTLATNLTLSEISEIQKRLEAGDNPRDIKILLAKAIIEIYHSKEAADQEEREFIEVFSKGNLPEEIKSIRISSQKYKLIDLLTEFELASSKSEAKRLIEGGGVKINQEKVNDVNLELFIDSEILVQVGKRKFLKFNI